MENLTSMYKGSESILPDIPTIEFLKTPLNQEQKLFYE